MQTVIQVVCTKGPSLRGKIASDPRIEKYELMVVKAKQPDRNPGWLKLRSTDGSRHGVINIEWHNDMRILECRVINRGRGRPDLIVGDFVTYLFARYRARIQSIGILPR